MTSSTRSTIKLRATLATRLCYVLCGVATVVSTQRAFAEQYSGHLKLLNSGKCLVARAAASEEPPVVQYSCDNRYSDQTWYIAYLDGGEGPEGPALVVNSDRGKCLVARTSGAPAAVTDCDETRDDQKWWFLRDPATGYYLMQNMASANCLVVRGGDNEARPVQSMCALYADQLWLWEGWF